MIDPSPITILNRAIKLDKTGLLTLLQEHAEAHRSFAFNTTNKAASLAALGLEDACKHIIDLINEDDLLAICHEVRLQVPAVHAANQILKREHVV